MAHRSLRAGAFAIGALAIIALTLAAPAFAQSTGAIQGTVTDASGAPVPNASVTVKDPDHGVDRRLITWIRPELTSCLRCRWELSALKSKLPV